jgi:hypothetical protein
MPPIVLRCFSAAACKVLDMAFDAAFALDLLLTQLSWRQELTFPPGWQQTGTVTVDQSTMDEETASGLAKIIVSEDCDWGFVARKGDVSVIAIRGTETQHQWLEDFRAIAQPVPHGPLVDSCRFQ